MTEIRQTLKTDSSNNLQFTLPTCTTAQTIRLSTSTASPKQPVNPQTAKRHSKEVELFIRSPAQFVAFLCRLVLFFYYAVISWLPSWADMTKIATVTPTFLQLEQGQTCNRRSHHTPMTKSADSPTIKTVTTDTVTVMQRQGPSAVATMYERIKSHRPLSTSELTLAEPELKKLSEYYSRMSINQEQLLIIERSHNNRRLTAVVCPPQIRESVIWDVHKQDHAGISRTTSRIKLKWFWPGMTNQVRRSIKTCEVCQLAKHSNPQRRSTNRHLTAGRPWQWVAVDLVGPLPETPRQNKWILVLTDHFTRWQDAIPIPDGTTPVVAQALDSRIFSYFGIPEQLHTDQGSQFDSALMHELCQIWGINKTRTTPYHPQGNGMVERQNRTLGDSLRALLLGADQEGWDLLLPHLMRTFRATPHSRTSDTPNYLMMGREIRVPDTLQYDITDTSMQPVEEYARDLQNRMSEAHRLLRQHNITLRSDNLDEGPLYNNGDTVYLTNHRQRRGQSRKLASKFLGPYRVIKSFPNHTYEIERNGQRSIRHERQLKQHTTYTHPTGRAPVILEPTRRPTNKGRPRRATSPDDYWNTDYSLITYDAPPQQNLHQQVGLIDNPPADEPQPNVPQPPPPPEPSHTRSGRPIRQPAYLKDYVT